MNYISNLNINSFSGGWSGMNQQVFLQLKKCFDIHLVQDINPSYSFFSRLSSKLARVAKIKAVFPAFTPSRLDNIATQVSAQLDKEAKLNFFHGATPWLHLQQALPYALYVDASFATYIRVYHQQDQFSDQQLATLFSKEAAFLKNAKAVFFSSAWAMKDAMKAYTLSGENFHVAGLGGGFHAITDTIKTEPYFLFVGLDFAGKGGVELLNAFKQVRHEFPKFRLKLVGQKPSAAILQEPGVEYIGFINKKDAAGLSRLQALFAAAYCFVLPTGKDMTPLVLVEAGSMGCPVISVNNFGISEIVQHERTGLLIDPDQETVPQLITAMRKLCSDPEYRDTLGMAAKEYIKHNYSWDRTGEIICRTIME